MAKSKIAFFCNSCGFETPKWAGQCPGCKEWNTLVEEKKVTGKGARKGWAVETSDSRNSVISLSEKPTKENLTHRTSTGYNELDRVLGGGLVKGSYVLVGGDPGIGKSTLLLQMAGGLSQHKQKILYASGEESTHQTSLRAHRLGINSSEVLIASLSQIEEIIHIAEKHQPDTLIVDSIQTVFHGELSSAPGSVSQVRECAAQLMTLAKQKNMSVFIIGHVTKDGNIAGPKVLEHMVDTVLSFEGDGHHHFRLLRALKNRFGATNELGVFQMSTDGLTEVSNPSELFLEERGTELNGSSVFASMEGSRPLLCEIQSLTNPSPMAMPRRTAIGFDTHRLHLLIAVLDRYLNLNLSSSDVFVNVVGGLRLNEPSADLAVAAALISTKDQLQLPSTFCFFGEMGLTGEIRAVNFALERIKEAAKLGFTQIVLPFSNKKHLSDFEKSEGAELIWIKNVNQLIPILKKAAFYSKDSDESSPSHSMELDF